MHCIITRQTKQSISGNCWRRYGFIITGSHSTTRFLFGSSTLCHSYGFACQQGVLKTCPGPDYLSSEDGIFWLWHFLVNLPVYSSTFYLMGQCQFLMIGRDGGLSTPCHSYAFTCQQRVLKMFSCPGSLRSEDGIAWLWHAFLGKFTCTW